MSNDLTDDEFTVLLIAQQGESMMPIARWEKPVNDLVERGLLHRHDKFNNTITENGKEALRTHAARLDHELLTGMNKAVIVSKKPASPEIPVRLRLDIRVEASSTEGIAQILERIVGEVRMSGGHLVSAGGGGGGPSFSVDLR